MAAVLLANILLFPTLSIYLGNLDEFSLPLFGALKVSALMFLVGTAILFLLVRLLTPADRARIGLLFAGLSLLCWLQANLLVWDYGVLDGRDIPWREHRGRQAIDLAAWLLLAVGMVILARRKPGMLVRAATFVFLLQLVTAGVSLGTAAPPLFGVAGAETDATEGEISRFSRHHNILHIVTDGFQSDIFEELLEDTSLKERYDASFDGFQFYRETLGVFPYTRFSVPAFLSGKLYANEPDRDAFVDGALSGPTIVSLAADQGYRVDIAAEGHYFVERYANLPHENVLDFGALPHANSTTATAALLTDLALFRVAPGPLKQTVYNDQQWRVARWAASDRSAQFRYFTTASFLERFTDSMRADVDAPVYKYLHVMNTHEPMVVDEDCEFAGRTLTSERRNLLIQSRCSMDSLAQLLDRMKTLGIYDSALIVIHGDHGGWVGTRRQGPDVVLPDGKVMGKWVRSLASPVLAIKPPHASGGITTSDTLASLLDIPDTMADIMAWDRDFGHLSLVNAGNDGDRTRIFRFYFFKKNAWQVEYTGPIWEFGIDGSHYESAWTLTRTFSPQPGE